MQGIDHYENFPVASWLCPARLRPAIVALYHFARTADDLADEGDASASERLDCLHRYRADLQACLSAISAFDEPNPHLAAIGAQWSQVFIPLAHAVAAHSLPHDPLLDLLDAFEQDVIYTRDGCEYATQAQLLDYCRRSANPVGRLLLHLYGVHHEEALHESDAVCTALQLINFWQDRVVDVSRGRNYLPTDSTWPEQLRLASQKMHEGAALVHRVKGRAGWELRLVIQGGLRILDKLQASHGQQDPILHPAQFQRPQIRPWDVVVMLWRALWM